MVPRVPPDRVRQARVVVVGAGISGLAAAWTLRRAGVRDVVVLDAEPRLGGTSGFGVSPVTPYPYGAHYVPVPSAQNRALVMLLQEAGALDGVDALGQPRPAEHALIRAPEERIFLRGRWHAGLWPRALATPEDQRQYAAFQLEVERLAALRDARGRPGFTVPVRTCSDDPLFTALDRVSMGAWMDARGLQSPRLRWFVDYACRDDYGSSLHDTSAWAGLFYFAARQSPGGGDSAPFLSWPEGNGRIAGTLAAPLRDAVRLDAVVLDVNPRQDGVDLTYLEASVPTLLRAQRVVLAIPKPFLKHVVRPWRDAPPAHLESFRFGPWMTANLHLRTRPPSRGVEVAWDNVIHDSPSLGYVVATHQRGPDAGPTTWTWYHALAEPSVKDARRALLSLTEQECADIVLSDLKQAHPDLEQHVESLEVFRHGHAMVRPDVGFIWGPDRLHAAEPVGRVHFAHCDLSGLALVEEALDQGVRAGEEVLAALGVPFQTLL
jgi:protoporphyrinogen oxidase